MGIDSDKASVRKNCPRMTEPYGLISLQSIRTKDLEFDHYLTHVLCLAFLLQCIKLNMLCFKDNIECCHEQSPNIKLAFLCNKITRLSPLQSIWRVVCKTSFPPSNLISLLFLRSPVILAIILFHFARDNSVDAIVQKRKVNLPSQRYSLSSLTIL